DSQGNLFVANVNANTVSEFAPGSTTPTATLTGLNAPNALAFDREGNLFVANFGSGAGTTVSEFAATGTAAAPGGVVTATATQPVVSSSRAYLPANASSLTINGFGFDTNPANDTVSFSGGATGTVTNATATQLTVGNLSGLTPGSLSASVSTLNGG